MKTSEVKLATSEIPQADKIEVVLESVKSVSQGAETYQEIADFIGYKERQGRYYRLAAEILGLLCKRGRNTSSLSPLGESFVSAVNENKKIDILRHAILNSSFFQRVIPFLELNSQSGVTRSGVEEFIKTVTAKTTDKMIHRRTATVISWLKYTDLIEMKNHKYFIKTLPDNMPIVDYKSINEPLLPSRFDLSEYKAVLTRTTEAEGYISYEIKRAKRDRASRTHNYLTDLVAKKIRKEGCIPKRNIFIDLAAQVERHKFLFEIKSTTEKNAHSQIRRGISQLYEYRYLQAVPDAKLILVIEKPLVPNLKWIADYLIQDRGIYLVWDDDEEHLHAPKSTCDILNFLL